MREVLDTVNYNTQHSEWTVGALIWGSLELLKEEYQTHPRSNNLLGMEGKA